MEPQKVRNESEVGRTSERSVDDWMYQWSGCYLITTTITWGVTPCSHPHSIYYAGFRKTLPLPPRLSTQCRGKVSTHSSST